MISVSGMGVSASRPVYLLQAYLGTKSAGIPLTCAISRLQLDWGAAFLLSGAASRTAWAIMQRLDRSQHARTAFVAVCSPRLWPRSSGHSRHDRASETCNRSRGVKIVYMCTFLLGHSALAERYEKLDASRWELTGSGKAPSGRTLPFMLRPQLRE